MCKWSIFVMSGGNFDHIFCHLIFIYTVLEKKIIPKGFLTRFICRNSQYEKIYSDNFLP
jgi:hypothetical protein